MPNRVFRSDEFWNKVRKDYDAGMSFTNLTKKYKLSKGTLGNRIARQNWDGKHEHLISKPHVVKSIDDDEFIAPKDEPKKNEPKIKIEPEEKHIEYEKPKEEPKELKIKKIPKAPKPINDEKLKEIYEKNKKTVNGLLLSGTPFEIIANIVGISENVFERLFYKEIQGTVAIANSKVAIRVYEMATDPAKPSYQSAKLWMELHGLIGNAKPKETKEEPQTPSNPFEAFLGN